MNTRIRRLMAILVLTLLAGTLMLIVPLAHASEPAWPLAAEPYSSPLFIWPFASANAWQATAHLNTVHYSGWSRALSSYASSSCSGHGIYLYDRNGNCRKWTENDPTFVDDGFNDVAASIRFVGSHSDGKYVAILYEHADYQGAFSAYGEDDPDFGNDMIQYRASSIRIKKVPQCTGSGIYLYEDIKYGGRCRKFTEDYLNLSDTAFNDIASSVRLVGDYGGGKYEVILCRDAESGKPCSRLISDDKNLGNNEIGHDQASSVQIRKVKPKLCIPSSGLVSQRFKPYTKPGVHSHEAVDIAGGKPNGTTPVYAAHDGKVVYIGPAHANCGYKYAVAIRYSGKVYGKYVLTLYNHMGHWNGSTRKFESYVRVKLGADVKKGQLIGYQGDAPSGVCGTETNGVHLHFAVYEKDEPFLDRYTSWGATCARTALFFETGATTANCSLPKPAKAIDPEVYRYLGPLSSPVKQSCSK